MKKFKFLGLALFAVVLCAGFASCGNNNEDEGIGYDSSRENPIEDILKEAVGSLPGSDDKATVVKVVSVKDADSPIKELLLTKGKKVIARPSSALKKSASRAYTPTVVLEGTYEIQGTKIIINIPGFSEPITIDALQLISNGMKYAAEVEDIAEPTEILDKSLCREWKMPVYQAVVMFDKMCVYNGGDDSFFALQDKMLTALGKKDVKLDILKSEIKGLNIYTDGTANVLYANGDAEVVNWSWKNKAKGIMNMTINGNDVTVDVRFKAGNPNKVTFVISANFSAIGVGGTHNLDESRLIITMVN